MLSATCLTSKLCSSKGKTLGFCLPQESGFHFGTGWERSLSTFLRSCHSGLTPLPPCCLVIITPLSCRHWFRALALIIRRVTWAAVDVCIPECQVASPRSLRFYFYPDFHSPSQFPAPSLPLSPSLSTTWWSAIVLEDALNVPLSSVAAYSALVVKFNALLFRLVLSVAAIVRASIAGPPFSGDLV